MGPPKVTEPTVMDSPDEKLLCLTILGYRKPGMTEQEYRHHMTTISAPMTQELMIKYGMVRWTQVGNYENLDSHSPRLFTMPIQCVPIDIRLTPSFPKVHNQSSTRAQMSEIVDTQMVNVADFDCFSQVVFKSIDDYKSFKSDPYYKKHLFEDHVHFADTQRSQ